MGLFSFYFIILYTTKRRTIGNYINFFTKEQYKINWFHLFELLLLFIYFLYLIFLHYLLNFFKRWIFFPSCFKIYLFLYNSIINSFFRLYHFKIIYWFIKLLHLCKNDEHISQAYSLIVFINLLKLWWTDKIF